MNWREVMRLKDNADLDFAAVHDRYRELMLTSSKLDLDAERLRLLAEALEAARKELGTQRPLR